MIHAGVRLSLPQTSAAAHASSSATASTLAFSFVAVRIAATAIVAQSFHSSDADAEIDKAFAPGTAECVSDEKPEW